MTKHRDALRERAHALSDAAHEANIAHQAMAFDPDATPEDIAAAQAEFLRLWDERNAAYLALARRDDPNRQPTGRMPRRALIDGRYVKTGRTVKVDGVRVPLVEYLR